MLNFIKVMIQITSQLVYILFVNFQVSLACVALVTGQVQFEGSPEWQAHKNAELAHIAPSPGPLGYLNRNFAQEQLNYQASVLAHVAPSPGPLAHLGRNFAQEQLNYQASVLAHQQQALNFIASGAGRHKRQVQVVGSPEWQAYKNAELAHIAPSPGPLGYLRRNFAQEQLNHQASALAHIAPSPGPLAHLGRNFAQEQLNYEASVLAHQQQALSFIASGAGRRKRQVQVEGSPEWQAYKNAELAFIAPSVGPTPHNFAQTSLNFIAPSPGPLSHNYAQSSLDFIAPRPVPETYAQAQLRHQQEALNFIAQG